MRARLTAALVLLLVVLAAACGDDDDDDATTTTSRATTTSTAPPDVYPLTGLPADPAHRDRPALVVKIDNAPLGRPQAGINEADVVVNEGVEGGITRLAAIFHSADAEAVGPVRSARSTDIVFSTQLGRPLFAYSGANAIFARQLQESPLVDVGVGQAPGDYRREPGRPSLYNLFSSTPALYDGAPAGATPPAPLFTYRAPGQPAPAGEPAPVVEMFWSGRVRTEVVYEWDAAAGGFARTQHVEPTQSGGTPHVDAAGTRVAPQNVVLQVVPYRDTGLKDRSGAAVPEAELVGEGEVVVLTDGKLVRGRWRRSEAGAVTSYVDEAGEPIRLTPGRTWLELVPPGNLTIR